MGRVEVGRGGVEVGRGEVRLGEWMWGGESRGGEGKVERGGRMEEE